MTLEDWNSFLQVASAVMLGLTFLVGAGALWTSRLINHQLTERVAALGREAADATAGSSQALADVAAANERAARLEAELAQERERVVRAQLDLSALEERMAGRRLRLDQREEILVVLREVPLPRTVAVSWAGVGEAARFADDLVSVLQEVGWSTVDLKEVLGAEPPVGLILTTDSPENETAAVLRTALEAAGLEVDGGLNPELAAGRVELVVGIKPHAEPTVQ